LLVLMFWHPHLHRFTSIFQIGNSKNQEMAISHPSLAAMS